MFFIIRVIWDAKSFRQVWYLCSSENCNFSGNWESNEACFCFFIIKRWKLPLFSRVSVYNNIIKMSFLRFFIIRDISICLLQQNELLTSLIRLFMLVIFFIVLHIGKSYGQLNFIIILINLKIIFKIVVFNVLFDINVYYWVMTRFCFKSIVFICCNFCKDT